MSLLNDFLFNLNSWQYLQQVILIGVLFFPNKKKQLCCNIVYTMP